ncbi:uncharacterized protein A1O5_10779 [Cladophialophora psammophila CBS 110553]|uniref:Xylanolytic transcriptional activator regulatory domain-containing protein n=1 Tax=Cladophialophora psammophila CBS 110553 TaxID=1182543 RepID=W9WDY9_9EURO|nr:uncharacterized protein A1O5_10779 [Cladophialophora psammophila CBS 110553]EXJ66163.1 hypothetical protein A1O5_10779 [Cladophialophora psammophila CBS 110553]
MTRWDEEVTSPTRREHLSQGREVMEYHGGTNQMTILSEVLGRLRPKRFVRIVLSDTLPSMPNVCSTLRPDLTRMDKVDREYLKKKRAFDFPPRHVCDRFLRLYFDCVYPYAPIFDRVEFVQQYKNGSYSAFLLQAILACVASYASSQLIREAGFSDHVTAQRTFFLRASLLCDLKAECQQLRLLQGSLVLSLLNFTFAIDKDYRYWLSNAVRIATQMGLHQDNVAKDLDTGTRTLFRRLWWVIYNRDALLVSSGLDNARRIHDSDFDTSELELSDWPEENITEDVADVLRPISRLQKLFLIESCAHYVQTSRFSETALTKGWPELEGSLATWRMQLPAEMRTEGVYDWCQTNIWPLVLMARCYLLECIVYRVLRDSFRASGDAPLADRSARRLQTAMFELDSILDRIMLHNLARYCPLYMMNCTSTLLALHIETALHQSASEEDRLAARIRIHQAQKYLRGLSDYWSSIKWAQRLFEVIVSRTGLSLVVPPQPIFDLHSSNPFNPGGRNNGNLASGKVGDAAAELSNNNSPRERPDALPSPATSPSFIDFVDIDDTLGNMMGRYAEDWLQDLFGDDFGALDEQWSSTQ